MGFEPTIPVSKRAKTVHALDHSATVTGSVLTLPAVILCAFLRQEILERRNARRQRRQDMAKRRTAAAQEHMRLISQLARKEKRDDTFGMRDEDWDVYKVINKVLITTQTLIWDLKDGRHVTCWLLFSSTHCCVYSLNKYTMQSIW